jgi:hypothetical protein
MLGSASWPGGSSGVAAAGSVAVHLIGSIVAHSDCAETPSWVSSDPSNCHRVLSLTVVTFHSVTAATQALPLGRGG